MIRGIGVDIVETARFNKKTTKFVRMILTNNELEEYYIRKRPLQYLATRFAAKEAAVKAIGKAIPFHLIEISNSELGEPILRFLTEDIAHAHLSISDEEHYVVAMVILE